MIESQRAAQEVGGEPLPSEKCPDCDASITIADDALKGEIVTCPDCGLDLEVMSAGPGVGLKPLVIEKEDWGE